TVLADMMRLNTAIPPSSSPNPLGIIGGDLAGFPNGPPGVDDVVSLELRAIAGAAHPPGKKTYTPGGAARPGTPRPTPARRPARRQRSSWLPHLLPPPGRALRRLQPTALTRQPYPGAGHATSRRPAPGAISHTFCRQGARTMTEHLSTPSRAGSVVLDLGD